jgi:hypothetical protein
MLYRVNLTALSAASQKVTSVSYRAISQTALAAYLDWLEDQLMEKHQAEKRQQILQAVRGSCERLIILMDDSIDNYVTWIANKLEAEMADRVPIYPVVNDEIKSDVWLTGLVVAELAARRVQMNPRNVGYAVGGTQTGEIIPRSPGVRGASKVVYIDDAIYPGKQAFTVGANAGACGIFGMSGVQKAVMIFTEVTTQAKEFLNRVAVIYQTELDSQPFQHEEVMRALPLDAGKSSALPGAYVAHVEVDPATGLLVPKSGQGETFNNISYGMPPYKIPDSISVPTHVYATCGYHKPAGSNHPETLHHLFMGNGSVDGSVANSLVCNFNTTSEVAYSASE